MGLDQYLHSTNIPQAFFETVSKFGEDTLDLIISGFYYEEDAYNEGKSYVYFRKSWPIDYLIKNYVTWQYDDTFDYCYYISPENTLKIYNDCLRVLRMLKPCHDLSDQEIIDMDTTKLLDDITFHYPEGSTEYLQVLNQLDHIIEIDTMCFSLEWEISTFIDTVKLIARPTNAGNGLFYIRSY